MKKVFFIFAAFMAIASVSEAKNPKTADSKATNEIVTSPSEVKSGTTLNTYYVTRIDPMNSSLYDISTSPNPDCGNGSDSPCEFQTSQTLGTTIPKTNVDNEVNLTITDTQAQLH